MGRNASKRNSVTYPETPPPRCAARCQTWKGTGGTIWKQGAGSFLIIHHLSTPLKPEQHSPQHNPNIPATHTLWDNDAGVNRRKYMVSDIAPSVPLIEKGSEIQSKSLGQVS